MTRLALLSSEPLGERMAGIGIRYLELARRLPRPGLEVVLFSTAATEETPEVAGEVRRFNPGDLAWLLGDCDAVLGQGQLVNHLFFECPDLPTAIDLYDPWLVENLSYVESLGYEPWKNDHSTWMLQLSRGDFFLCSSEEQRLYYLGLLTAAGRVNPESLRRDPDLSRLVAEVPFGVPETLPPYRPVLEPPAAGRSRLLFGGLYDWYDPFTLLAALETLDDLPWELVLVQNPHPTSTPQRLMDRVEAAVRRRRLQERVRIIDWVPAGRRYDLLRDCDLMVTPYRPSLETRLSLRTRFLDALAAGRAVVLSEGGTMARLVAEHDAGWVVPAGSAEALAGALRQALTDVGERERRAERGRRLVAERFAWERVLAPLVEFALQPRRDPAKERFAVRPPTVAAEEPFPRRLLRRGRRLLARVRRTLRSPREA